jgi:F-type H+-transporting ATPase subunit delta
MNSVRVARLALRARPSTLRAPLQRRGYADAVSDKIKLTLALPHQVCQIAAPLIISLSQASC